MKKRISIRQLLLTGLLIIILPANIAAVSVCVSIIQKVQAEVEDTLYDSLLQFRDHMQMRLDSSQQYILQQFDQCRGMELKGDAGDLGYEIAKSELKGRLDKQLSNAYAGQCLIDCAFVYIRHTDQTVDARNTDRIPTEAYQDVLKWMRTATKRSGWYLQQIGGECYLATVAGNSVMNMGILIKDKTFLEEWTGTKELGLCLMEADDGNAAGQENRMSCSLDPGNIEIALEKPGAQTLRDIPLSYQILFSLLLATALLVLVIFLIYQRMIVRPLKKMEDVLHRIQMGETSLRLSGCDGVQEFALVQTAFNDMMDSIYSLKIRNYEMQLRNQKMELENQKVQLENLQMQINPHLLLNTLNTIYSLAEIEEYASIKSFTMYLVKYFRYSLNDINRFVTVKEELAFVESYVGIQRMRFQDCFNFIYDADESVLELLIPPLVIENFVENSIKYCKKQNYTEIMVLLRKQENRLIISICDDGGGIPGEILEQLNQDGPLVLEGETHVGIWNCRKRLKLLYGDGASLNIHSEDGSTQVYIEIPAHVDSPGLEHPEGSGEGIV